MSSKHEIPKVAIVHHWFPAYRREILQELAHRYPGTFVFISGTEGWTGALAGDVENSTNVYLRNCWWRGLLWQRGLAEQLEKQTLQSVVFLGDYRFMSTWSAVIRYRMRGLRGQPRPRVFLWTQGWGRSLPRNIIRSVLYHSADGLLLYGESETSRSRRWGFSHGRLTTIYNGIVEWTPMSRGPVSGDIAIFVGRLVARKRLELMLDAAALCNPSPRLLFVGAGPEAGQLQKRADQLGVETTFTGEVQDKKHLERLFGQATVCVIPDATGLTAIHAMAHGVPVVAPDTAEGQGPEWEALAPGVTGEHFRRGDAASLAEALSMVLASGRDHYQPGLEAAIRIWSPKACAARIAEAVVR